MKDLSEISFNNDTMDLESFRTILEDHLTIIGDLGNLEEIKKITPVDANRFEYDFYGLLRSLGIPMDMYWITLRINGMSSPHDYRKTLMDIKIPKKEIINSLLSYHNQVVKRSSG